ncbi:MAG: DinB family protein [Longimicrobiales bacterium]
MGQLNWKPAPDSWSVGQCLDHLININREYDPTFDRIQKGEHERRLLAAAHAITNRIGEESIRSAFARARSIFCRGQTGPVIAHD